MSCQSQKPTVKQACYVSFEPTNIRNGPSDPSRFRPRTITPLPPPPSIDSKPVFKQGPPQAGFNPPMNLRLGGFGK